MKTMAIDSSPAGPAPEATHPDPLSGDGPSAYRASAAVADARDVQSPERRRFLWRADAGGRITSVTGELGELVGERAGAIVGLSWPEIADAVVLDGGRALGEGLTARTLWADHEVLWRADDGTTVPVALIALPAFDRRGELAGFRGAGTIDPARRRVPASAPPIAPAADEPPSEAASDEPSPEPDASDAPAGTDVPVLSFAEQGALAEIARALGARIEPAGAHDASADRASADIVTLPVRAPRAPPVAAPATPPAAPDHSRADDERSRDPAARPAAAPSDVRLGNADTIPAAQEETEPPESGLSRGVAETARLRHAERERRETERLLDVASEALVVFDASGRLRSLNRAARTLFGRDARDLAGKMFTTLVAPESHQTVIARLGALRAASGDGSSPAEPFPVTGRDAGGWKLALDATVHRLGDEADAALCVAFKARAGAAAAEPAGERQAVRLDRMAAIDLVAKLDGRLRSPLNGMVGFAALMMEERSGPLANPRRESYLARIHDNGVDLVNLLDELGGLAQAVAGDVELSFARVDPNRLAADRVEAVHALAARGRIVLRTSFAPNVPPLIADHGSLERAVALLVSNALRRTGTGGQVIVSTTMTDRGHVALRVRDTGPGLTPFEREAAFEPFGHAREADAGETGLELPLARALIELNHGTLGLLDAPSNGTVAEILFPPSRVLA